MKIGIYPGSFDPVTNGHLDVINRARSIFDKVVVAVARNAAKEPMFSSEERVRLIEENLVNRPNISVIAFDGLIVDLARELNAVALIRGLRAVSDFEHEFQMAQMNRHLDEKIETIFLVPNERYFFTSSNLVKQVFKFTDREKHLIPENVHAALSEKLGHRD
ncbi:pantetheine-phosphate adenylyltransferase [Coraliomargarita sinensis]|uniref:Phosphopantetheine adenylyltransferase n=1 Tax=Coraliomargarita sinensis TaxID=2174842 RepID=A0A317ZHV9_9BACT|nr:pantetheine-phosphate adenylyltransferase [Coraliomargarita sinensis]PXA04562.1 pantetheine-phosphate adenylyltransferase [Coraliomargarita sinensis]